MTLMQISLNLVIMLLYSACVHEKFVHLLLSKTNLNTVDSRLFSCGKAKRLALVFQEGLVRSKKKKGKKKGKKKAINK